MGPRLRTIAHRLFLTALVPCLLIAVAIPITVLVWELHDAPLRASVLECLAEVQRSPARHPGRARHEARTSAPASAELLDLVEPLQSNVTQPEVPPEEPGGDAAWEKLRAEIADVVREAAEREDLEATACRKCGAYGCPWHSDNATFAGAWGDGRFRHHPWQPAGVILLGFAPAALLLGGRAWLRWLLRPTEQNR